MNPDPGSISEEPEDMTDSAEVWEPTSIEFRRFELEIEPERFHCRVPNDEEYLGTDPEREEPPDDDMACS